MTSISNLGQALDQIARLKTQQNTMDLLSTQISTGKKTQQFSGLGTDILRSQRARASISAIEQYTNNIVNAHRRMDLMSNSLEHIAAQANNVANALTVGPQGGDYPDFATTQELATDVYDFVLDLINVKDGERFLFAGSDSSVQPIEDKGLFDAFLGEHVLDQTDLVTPITVSGFIGDWGDGTITTEEFIAAYRGVSEEVVGYSNPLTSGTTGEVRVRVDDNSDFDYTVLGNTAGIKDIVIALGVLKNMPPPEFAPGALNTPNLPLTPLETPPFPPEERQENFYQVINDLGQMIAQAVDNLQREEQKLGLVQAQTQIIQDQYIYQKDAFQSTISEVEDVDLTETVAKIQQVQIGLEASFSVTAIISDLTLVNFLTR